MNRVIEKKLSANDIGATGAHQAGILIPKKDSLLSFFPELNPHDVNPRTVIRFIDELNCEWKFNFIYYNNKLRGGTRNEYRLTGMTPFFKQNAAKVDDVLIFIYDGDEYYIKLNKETNYIEGEDGVTTLVLDDTWKVINY